MNIKLKKSIVFYERNTPKNPRKTLVFLHGWQGLSESWKCNTVVLSNLFDVLPVDLPVLVKPVNQKKFGELIDSSICEGFYTKT